MTKITAPIGAAAAGLGAPGGARFDADGTFETEDEAIIGYCRGAGYGIGSEPAGEAALDTSEVAAADARGIDVDQNPSRVRSMLAEPADPRDLDDTAVGGRLRDAAVDPRPTDFLPPTNAGKANPHGPLVVAPGIHGIESQVIRPGVVHVDDLQAQQKAETDQAIALLVEGRQVDQALPTFVRADENGEGGSDTGPLGLSDPGSVPAIETGNAADIEDATMPDGTSAEPPAGNAGRDAWATYASSRGATEMDLTGLSRNDIRDMYTPAAQ